MHYDSRYEDEGREGSTVLTRLRGMIARDERATAAVEFALLLPVMMAILIGTIDFGRFAYYAIGVTNAARAGASLCNYVSVATNCNASLVGDVKQEVIDEAKPAIDLNPSTNPNAQITVTPGTSYSCGNPSGPCLKVTVSYLFSTLLPLPRPASGSWVWSKEAFYIVRTAHMRAGIN